MKKLMSYEKFKFIMNILQEFINKRDRISDFFEKELMEDSFCFVTYGMDVERALVALLADEFDCWYSFKEDMKEFNWWTSEHHYGMENDIEDWLYPINNEEGKSIEINGKKIDITSLESFYDFLVSQYNEKHKFD